MANDFIVSNDLIVFERASIGDSGLSTSGTIVGTLDIVRSSGDATIKIISNNTSTASLDFADIVAPGLNVGSLSFNHNTDTFQLSINNTPQMTIDSSGVTITGQLVVQGILTQIDSTTTTIVDNTIVLNKDEVGLGVTLGTAGIEIDRGFDSHANASFPNASWLFDDSDDSWGPDAASGMVTLKNIDQIITSGSSGTLIIDGDGALTLPDGTTGQRPGSPEVGMLRYNTTDGNLEFYDSSWRSLSFVSGQGIFVSRTGDSISGDLTFTGASQLFITDGTAADPGLAFALSPGTGLYSPGTNSLSLTTNSADKMTIDSVGNISFISGTVGTVTFSGTAAMALHSGTTGQRPSPVNGMIRYNSTLDEFEGYENGTWKAFGTSATGGFVEIIGDTMTGDLNMAADILPDSTANLRDVGSVAKEFQAMYAVDFIGTASQAKYADLAERYAADMLLDVGTVVVFGGEEQITESSLEEDTAVAGVISGKPGVMMNSKAGEDDTHPYVALKGMVPCKVVGPVKKGDLMVTSHIRGHGKSVGKKAEHYTAFGRALENKDANSTELGVIMISII